MADSTHCAECARRELTLIAHQAELRRLAYAAQSKSPSRAAKAIEQIPRLKHVIAEAKRNITDHLETCTAVDRVGVTA